VVEGISIIIVNWNRKKDVLELLSDIGRQSYPKIETIIIDNGSKDGSVEAFKRRFPKAKVIPLASNFGFHFGINRGVREAKGKIVIVVDSDCTITDPYFVSKVAEKFENGPDIVACSFKNYYTKEPAWDSPLHSHIGNDRDGYDCLIFNSAGFGIRKVILDENKFNEEFFIYLGELELCLKLLEKGYVCKYFPDLVVFHKAIPNARPSNFREFLSTRNLFWWCWLYLPFQYLTLRMFGFRNLLAKFLHNEARESSAKGILCAITKLPWIIRNRKPLQYSIVKRFFDSFNNYTNKF